MDPNKLPKLIHIATIQEKGIGKVYLFLRQTSPGHFVWFKEDKSGQEIETSVSGPLIEDALFSARKFWRQVSFRTILCGFRYTLPERDEHGYNALFHQMIASYSSPNGIYFDEEFGSNCVIYNASNEARSLWKRLEQSSRL